MSPGGSAPGAPADPAPAMTAHVPASLLSAAGAGVAAGDRERARSTRPAATRRALVGGGLALLAAACAGPRRYAARPMAVDVAAAAALTNRFRAENGLGPLAVDATLAAAASRQAQAMAEADHLGHSVGWGDGLPARLAAVGYDWSASAENVAAGYPSLDAAFASWVGSPGHRRNLLNPRVTAFGIAAWSAPATRWRTFWAMVMAAPRRPAEG